MFNPVSTFLFIATGSFSVWMIKGFKGPFDQEMISIDERHSRKGTIRYYLGMCIWIAIFISITIVMTKPTKQKFYKVIKTNEKGELLKLEEIKTKK